MKRFIRMMILMMAALLFTGICFAEEQPAEIIDLGIPTAQRYRESELDARNPWDMVIHNGILYVGCGDYSVNTGHVNLFGCDLTTHEWKKMRTITEEAVLRFVTIGDQLLIPGTDPLSDWPNGFYYALTDGKWKTNRVMGAIHMYDIVDFDHARFVGIGTSGDMYRPVLLQREGEKRFENAVFMMDGQEMFGKDEYTRLRTYDIFMLNGKMYATVEALPDFDGLFVYQDGAFHYHSSPLFLKEKGDRQGRIYEKVVLGDTVYFTNGKLRSTSDFQEIAMITLPDHAICEFLLLDTDESGQETMYVLGSKKSEGELYRTIIWRYEEGGNFHEVFSMESAMRPMSFAKDGDDFYIGMGSYHATMQQSEWIGRILKIDR